LLQHPEGVQYLLNNSVEKVGLVLSPLQYEILTQGETTMQSVNQYEILTQGETTMQSVNQYFEILGFKVKDSVTGFIGVCDSVSFDLYGCVQCTVRPPMGKDGKLELAQWFDWHRLQKVSKAPVIELPNFAFDKAARNVSGPAEKSVRG
jgi:hypothetical protein